MLAGVWCQDAAEVWVPSPQLNGCRCFSREYQPHQEVMWLLVDGSASENLSVVLASIYIPNETYPVPGRDAGFERLGADLVRYQQRGRVVLMGDFNARVRQALLGEDHIGRYGEPTHVRK